MCRSALALVTGLALMGCAQGGGIVPPTLAPTTPAPHLRQTADPATGATQLVLTPVPVDQRGQGDPVIRSRVAVGAMLVTRIEGRKRVGGLALVVQTVAAPTQPVMARNRLVTLEVDGVRVEADLSSESRLYTAELGPAGLVETLVIPVGYDFLTRVASTTDVRFAVGRHVRGALGARHQVAFVSFLQKVPAPAERTVDRVASIAP